MAMDLVMCNHHILQRVFEIVLTGTPISLTRPPGPNNYSMAFIYRLALTCRGFLDPVRNARDTMDPQRYVRLVTCEMKISCKKRFDELFECARRLAMRRAALEAMALYVDHMDHYLFSSEYVGWQYTWCIHPTCPQLATSPPSPSPSVGGCRVINERDSPPTYASYNMPFCSDCARRHTNHADALRGEREIGLKAHEAVLDDAGYVEQFSFLYTIVDHWIGENKSRQWARIIQSSKTHDIRTYNTMQNVFHLHMDSMRNVFENT